MKKSSLVVFLLAVVACQKPVSTSEAAATGPAKSVRAPSVAGQFYPGEPAALQATVRKFLDAVPKSSKAPVRIVLVPHAGYQFSGQVAATSFKQLGGGFDRVVVIAANHNGDARFSGVSVDRATHYQVPGLEVKVAAVNQSLLSRPGFVDEPAAHTMHMVEVELPFLSEVNGKPFELVPLIAGYLDRPATRAFAAELNRLADPKTLFVFSVDLSHYHPYDAAVALDKPCLSSLERMNADDVAACETDGTHVLLTMTELAAMQGLTPRLLTYANSGDTSGDKSRVVGYGALVYEDRFELGQEEQDALLRLARQTLEAQVRDGRAPLSAPSGLSSRYPRLATPRGAFVTLKKQGQLRGCIGSLAALRPLADDVAENAVNAAVHDSRFLPVKPDELSSIQLSISVLDAPRPLEGLSGDPLAKQLGETRPGLIIEYQGRRSTFLPEVWEELPEPADFLTHLCAKQGSPGNCWRSLEARFQTYGSQFFAESSR